MAKLLIVDSDDRINTTLQEMFARRGFNAQGTWSGRDALKLLESETFDVLVVDDYLADIHAREFLDRVSQMPVHPRIVEMHRPSPEFRKEHYDDSLEFLRAMMNVFTAVDRPC